MIRRLGRKKANERDGAQFSILPTLHYFILKAGGVGREAEKDAEGSFSAYPHGDDKQKLSAILSKLFQIAKVESFESQPLIPRQANKGKWGAG
jgi:hypothetical protein